MSVGPNPPPSAPMLSPDHKWVWDGSQWQPIADPSDPAHKSVFAAYSHATSNVPVPVADARPLPGPPPVEFVAPVPLNVGRPKARRATTPQVPGLLWDRPQAGLNKYLYIVAGVLVAVIAVAIALQFVGLVPSSLRGAPKPQPTQSAGGAPYLSERSEYGLADRYFKTIITPSLAALADVVRPFQEGCHGAMTVACSSTVGPLDRELRKMLAAMDGAQVAVPECVSANVAAIRRDVDAMDAYINGMESASAANSSILVQKEYAAYEVWLVQLDYDIAASPRIQQAFCDPAITGP